jgi:hypothetical protein
MVAWEGEAITVVEDSRGRSITTDGRSQICARAQQCNAVAARTADETADGLSRQGGGDRGAVLSDVAHVAVVRCWCNGCGCWPSLA